MPIKRSHSKSHSQYVVNPRKKNAIIVKDYSIKTLVFETIYDNLNAYILCISVCILKLLKHSDFRYSATSITSH